MRRLLRFRPVLAVAAVYAAASVALWPVPVFNVLHAESMAAMAGVAFFAAGLAAIHLLQRGERPASVLAALLGVLLVPWALLTITALWAPNCGYAVGLLFFGLFPIVTTVFAVALAYLLAPSRRARAWLVGIGLGIVIVGTGYDLGLHPQFYVYNHVFGGVLGPIYDEELAIRPGLFIFRGLTLLWALLAVLLGRQRRFGAGVGRWERPLALGVVGTIGSLYLFAGPLGINTPAWYLQDQLGAVYETPHFQIYYDPDALDDPAVALLAEQHEYHYARLAELLDETVDEPIASYLYADDEAKARLTGARYTNVAPVWLRQPQVHVLLPVFERVFPHELAHVFSRAFGGPLRASSAVGLVEGFAVATEPPDARPTPDEQVSVAIMQRVGLGERPGETRLAETIAARLSPLGFWSDRGAVSYTTMGSFVRYLLAAYGPEPLKRAYAWGDFGAAYGKPVIELAREWEAHVLALPYISRAAGDLVARRFGAPSLFEKPCPHHVPKYRRLYQQAAEALVAGDTLRAIAHLDASLARQPRYASALALRSRLDLTRRAPRAVLSRLDTLALTEQVPALAVALGDAYALTGEPARARRWYAAAKKRTPLYAHESEAALELRRALAARPTVIEVLYAPKPPEEKAAWLAALPDGDTVTDVLRAQHLRRAGRPEDARAVFGRLGAWPDTLTAAERQALDRILLVWQAEAAFEAGALPAAQAIAGEAADAYFAAGVYNQAAFLRAWGDRVAWTERYRREQEARHRLSTRSGERPHPTS